MEIVFVPLEEKKPMYGAPVLLKTKGDVVQHITYMLDGADNEEDWFEPFYFDWKDDLNIPLSEVISWALLPGWDG